MEQFWAQEFLVIFSNESYLFFKDFTICFGVASIYSMYFHEKAIKFNIKALLRDMIIYSISIGIVVMVVWDGSINLYESLLLTMGYPIYMYISLKIISSY